MSALELYNGRDHVGSNCWVSIADHYFLQLLPIIIEHTIDERSPLCGHTFDTLQEVGCSHSNNLKCLAH